jgi:hypothetical protein
MRRMAQFSWIWLAGSIAWTIDGLVCLRFPSKQHSVLAFGLALLFAIAWAFYRDQQR